MAEQVNQRIENMINELEQMRRTNLYDDGEIREISRQRKEFEYRIQRRMKQKEDFAQYIAYELALLEDISLRRKQAKLGEKKKDIEYAIAKRLNKVFKQFIFRFQNDVEVYFQYIKFCMSVGFQQAVSGIIGQMLQMHGDKPKVWQMASKWESDEQNNLENARHFLLKGIHRHPESEILYLELFKIELLLAFEAEENEDKEKLLKRADIIWKNGMKNITNVSFLFKLCDLCMKFEIAESITNDIKSEIWGRRDNKEVWIYIASKELQGYHWEEIEEFIDDAADFPNVINNYIGVYEEALQKFPIPNLCTKYIHNLLGVSNMICAASTKIKIVKHAWMYGHENGLLTNEMYAFGIEFLKLENEMTENDFIEFLDTASKNNPQARCVWEQKLLLNKTDEKKSFSILQEVKKVLKPEDVLYLWNILLDNIDSNIVLKNLYKKLQNCDNGVLVAIKPKLLQKVCEYNGLKAGRELYEEFVRTPPTQIEVHRVMAELEKSQEKPNLKNIRKCYEYCIQHHGKDNVDIWMDYMQFENENGNAQASPAIYRRAIGMLKKELVDNFIKAQTLSKLK